MRPDASHRTLEKQTMTSILRHRLCAGLVRAGAASALAAGMLAAQAQPAGIDPVAQKLLKASTDFVASQKQFNVDTRNTFEIVLKNGQKLELNHTTRQSVQRPDKLRSERSGDLVKQVFIYDGKSLTLHNLTDKTYAQVAVPDTLEGMLDFARTKLDVVAPAGDLIYKNAYEILMADVTDGMIVGKAVIEGVRCDHLAFRAPHVDWQIWIQEGAQPLPRRLVISTRDVTNVPQFAVTITQWNLKPSFGANTFAFTPPAGVKRIDFMSR
jgi:hypothetical protein